MSEGLVCSKMLCRSLNHVADRITTVAIADGMAVFYVWQMFCQSVVDGIVTVLQLCLADLMQRCGRLDSHCNRCLNHL